MPLTFLVYIGKFYLVNGGRPLKHTFIPPYKDVRYHLKEYSTCAPQNPRKLFNLRHTSLRNTIERAFGVLKRLFPIIRSNKWSVLLMWNPIPNIFGLLYSSQFFAKGRSWYRTWRRSGTWGVKCDTRKTQDLKGCGWWRGTNKIDNSKWNMEWIFVLSEQWN